MRTDRPSPSVVRLGIGVGAAFAAIQVLQLLLQWSTVQPALKSPRAIVLVVVAQFAVGYVGGASYVLFTRMIGRDTAGRRALSGMGAGAVVAVILLALLVGRGGDRLLPSLGPLLFGAALLAGGALAVLVPWLARSAGWRVPPRDGPT